MRRPDGKHRGTPSKVDVDASTIGGDASFRRLRKKISPRVAFFQTSLGARASQPTEQWCSRPSPRNWWSRERRMRNGTAY
jgi:hypothetical protein